MPETKRRLATDKVVPLSEQWSKAEALGRNAQLPLVPRFQGKRPPHHKRNHEAVVSSCATHGLRMTATERAVKVRTAHYSRHAVLNRADDERPCAEVNVRARLSHNVSCNFPRA